MLSQIPGILLLIFGFGFVIFWHELGHFLAAKWADVKVEQFAVGMGQAICAWRRGIGLRWGSTTAEYEAALAAQKDGGEPVGDLSETEYRLNWIPLGGYVKMLGQDDLHPGVMADDPRSYNNKSIGKRMVIVSAGVVMNIILAAIGFMAVFLAGFKAPPAMVGDLQPFSPAQNAYRVVGDQHIPAPLQVGDTILTFDGKFQQDFTKLAPSTALAEEGVPLMMYVRHVDGTSERLWVEPAKPKDDPRAFLTLGIQRPAELGGLDLADAADFKIDPQLQPADFSALQPGEIITQINGQDVAVKDFWKLDQALQDSKGNPVDLTVASTDQHLRHVAVRPFFQEGFGHEPPALGGMLMRTEIETVLPNSPAIGKLLPGDVILSISDAGANGDRQLNPTDKQLIEILSKAGAADQAVNMVVLRNDKEVRVNNLTPSVRLSKDPVRYGIGIGLAWDSSHAVVATTEPHSAAALAGIPAGAMVVSIDGKPVTNFFDVDQLFRQETANKPISLIAMVDGKPASFNLGRLSADDLALIRSNRYTSHLDLRELNAMRQTSNPFIALTWGVGETRDAILQVYLMVRRMTQGSVSPRGVSGPLGIAVAGYGFVHKGNTWLLWFLSIISANLAVVNFLPIPILDGGLFVFLIVEKLKGQPVSARTQAIAQIVGLAILLSVFLFATYQDILRL